MYINSGGVNNLIKGGGGFCRSVADGDGSWKWKARGNTSKEEKINEKKKKTEGKEEIDLND